MMRQLLWPLAVFVACRTPEAPASITQLDITPPEVTPPVITPPESPQPTASIDVVPDPAPQVTGRLSFVSRHGTTLFRQGDLYSVGISRNAQFGATGGNEGVFAVWDLRTAHALHVIDTGQGPIHDIAISDDGKWAALEQDNSVRLWDVEHGTLRWTTHEITAELRFAPDGKHIASPGKLFDVADGRMIWQTPSNTFFDPDFAISDDATVIAGLVDKGASIEIRDNTDKLLRTFPAGTTGRQIAVSPTGDRIGVLDQTDLHVFTTSGRLIADHPVAGLRARESAYPMLGADPRYAFVWDKKNLIALDVVDHREAWRAQRGHFNPPVVLVNATTLLMSNYESCSARRISDGTELWHRDHCETFSTSQSAMLFARARGVLELLDAGTGNPKLAAPPPPDGPIAQIAMIAFSLDGARFATLAWDDSLWLWDPKTLAGHQLVNPPKAPLTNASMKFLGDGSLAVLTDERRGGPDAGSRHVLLRYDVDHNAITSTRELDGASFSAQFFGERVIAEPLAEHDCPRTAFDLHDRAAPKQLPPWKEPLHSAIYPERWVPCRGQAIHISTRDEKRMFIATAAGKLEAWDVAKRRVVATHDEPVDGKLILAPDERSLLVIHPHGPVVVLDAKDLHELRRFEGPRREYTSPAISSDSTLFAAVTPDGLVVWSLADGARVATVVLPSKLDSVTTVEFSPDGTTLWAGTSLGCLLELRVSP